MSAARGRWLIAGVLVVAVGGLLGVAAWFLLPRWCPGFVIRHSPWVEPAFRAIVHDSNHWDAWIDRVTAWGPRATPVLLRGLASPDADARMRSSACAWETGDPAVVPALVRALDDPVPSIRRSAISALGQFADPRAFEPLLARYGDPACRERADCGYQLGFFRDPRAVEPLLAGLVDPDPQMRNGAACSFQHLRDPRAVEPLLRALGDDVDYVRFNAGEALRGIALTPEQQQRAEGYRRRPPVVAE